MGNSNGGSRRFTYANVVGTVLLVAVLAGSAWAIGKNDVGSREIKPGAVRKSDLGRNAVNGSKVRAGALGRADLAAGALPQHSRIDVEVPAATEPNPTVETLFEGRGLTLSLLCRSSIDANSAELRATAPAGSRVGSQTIADPETGPPALDLRRVAMDGTPKNLTTLTVGGPFVLSFVNGVYTSADNADTVNFSVNLVAATTPSETCQARGTATETGP